MKTTLRTDVAILGDCLKVLKSLPDRSVHLIVTSPPYGDNRRRTYTGVPVNDYVEWFLPIAAELRRVLKRNGSFILNIKERVIDGERGVYVLQLIMALREQGWIWTEEYVWHKKNAYPGKWPNRFRDAWERCLHFTKSNKFKMYQDAVRVPLGDWAERRLARLSPADHRRDKSKVGNGFSKQVANWVGRSQVYPTNVLHLATESRNRSHSATFPLALPDFFIRLLTKRGDVVLDPFLGSGTSAIAAMRLDRRYVGVELNRTYRAVAVAAIAKERRALIVRGKRKAPQINGPTAKRPKGSSSLKQATVASAAARSRRS